MAETIKFLSYTGLQKYDSLIKPYILEAAENAASSSFKAVGLADGVLHFYTETPFDENSVPAYSITLPKEDLSSFMKLVDGAVEGNLATFGANGQVVDSGISKNSVATVAQVEEVSDALDAYKTSNDAAVEAAQKAADDAQAHSEALVAKVGTIPENQTVMEIITNIQENAYDDTELRGLISDNADAIAKEAETARAAEKANADAIAVLNGDETVEGSVAKDIKDAINDFATKVTDNSTFDTFKELVDYVAEHGGEAAEMASAIDALEALVGDKSVATQIAEAITAENLDQYATDEELADAIARIVVVEGKAHEHANKALLDTYTQTEADLADAVAKKHAHTNAAELDKIADGDVAKWNAAEQNAKDYADGKDAETLASAKEYTDAEVLKDRNRLDAIETQLGTGEGSVSDQIADALAEAKGYTDTEVAKDRERLAALEADTHTHANKAELDKFVDGDKAKLDDAASKAHVHENATVLDGITAEKVAAWDAAESNAKAHAEAKVKELADGAVKTNTDNIATLREEMDAITEISPEEISALFA